MPLKFDAINKKKLFSEIYLTKGFYLKAFSNDRVMALNVSRGTYFFKLFYFKENKEKFFFHISVIIPKMSLN